MCDQSFFDFIELLSVAWFFWDIQSKNGVYLTLILNWESLVEVKEYTRGWVKELYESVGKVDDIVEYFKSGKRWFFEEGMWLGREVLLIIFSLVMALAIDLYIIYTMAKAMTI